MIWRVRNSAGAAATLVLPLLLFPAVSFGQPHTIAEQYLFQAINSERAIAGLAPLRWSTSLTTAARSHALRMGADGSISHQLRGEPDLAARVSLSGAQFDLVAENVAAGNSVVEMHTGLMHSPHHRENILDPEVNEIGLSVIVARGAFWGVEDFAKTQIVLSQQEQEQQVIALLRKAGLRSVSATDEARETCRDPSSYSGERSAVVLHLTASNLSRLPSQLTARALQRDISEAAVGACSSAAKNENALYSIAVVLYR